MTWSYCVGVVIGPNATALAEDSGGIEYLAEFGVVFLMFVIGLEFNLPKLRSMRKLVFGLGLAQVLLTIVGALVGNALLVWLFSFTARAWELSWQGAVVLGGAYLADGTHMTQSQARAMVDAMTMAMERAGIAEADVDYVNAHATATRQGDQEEAKALRSLFGDRGILQLLRQRQRTEALAHEIEQLREENRVLAEEIVALRRDPAAVERLAREQLGLARPGESVFVLREPPPAQP